MGPRVVTACPGCGARFCRVRGALGRPRLWCSEECRAELLHVWQQRSRSPNCDAGPCRIRARTSRFWRTTDPRAGGRLVAMRMCSAHARAWDMAVMLGQFDLFLEPPPETAVGL